MIQRDVYILCTEAQFSHPQQLQYYGLLLTVTSVHSSTELEVAISYPPNSLLQLLAVADGYKNLHYKLHYYLL